MTTHHSPSVLEDPFVSSDSRGRHVPAWHGLLRFQATPVIAATVLLFVVASLIAPNSLTQASLLAMVVPATVLAVAAIGQTLVVQQKGIDLAAPGFITLGAMIVTVLPNQFGTSAGLAVLVALLVVALGGLLQGILITRFNVTPIIASLALNSLLFGAVWTVSGGSTLGAPDALLAFGKTSLYSVPLIVWFAVVLTGVTAVFMARTAIGRRFVGVGANPQAARASGVEVNRYIAGAYVASGVSAGLAGILLVSYLGKSSLSLGTPYLFPIISAVIVGGAVLSGGRGSVVATAIAALFLSQIVQIVLSFGAAQSVRLLVDAVAIAAATSLRLVPWGRFFSRGRQPNA